MEPAVSVDNADPARLRWSTMRDHYENLFASIPASRVLTPDAQIRIDADVIAGILARGQRFQAHQRKKCLNDGPIFLTAGCAGVPVLTGNRGGSLILFSRSR